MAWKLSFRSTYPEQNKRMAAIVVKGGSVLCAENNRLYKHAERRAIRPHADNEGATIYIARSNGRISKPCPECMDVIKSSGIRCICYINTQGNLVKEYIR